MKKLQGLTKKELQLFITEDDILELINFCELHTQYFKRSLILVMYAHLLKRK